MGTIRKLVNVALGAYFVHALIGWGFFDQDPTVSVSVTALFVCCYMLLKSMYIEFYIEHVYNKGNNETI